MTTLTEFLTARFDEDEADGGCGGPDRGCARLSDRWLAEIEAKRRIVGMHVAGESMFGEPVECDFCVEYVSVMAGDIKGEAFPCRTLRLLALPYADHPDWREEWRA